MFEDLIIAPTEKPENSVQKSKPWYPFYVGIDIGADFHVVACIPVDMLRSEKWKRSKTLKIGSDGKGLSTLLSTFAEIQDNFGYKPQDFFVLLEPTGGHYSYLLMKVLLDRGYHVYQVENAAVKDFREKQLGWTEKSDELDARIMAFMGWHKTLFPDMKAVRLVTPVSPTQVLFRTITRDRWILTQQLTSRKNQVQQLFSVTHPELKRAFSKTSSRTVMKLVLKYPTAQHMRDLSFEVLRQDITNAGGRTVAKKAASTLVEHLPDTFAVDIPHLVDRQTWLIQDALRVQEAISLIDKQIATLLYGDDSRGLPVHPYSQILNSFPVMSDNIACTIIGAIGDVERFSNYNEFRKYVGVSAENKTSGTSVSKSRQTYQGNRDTRRVFFLMALVLISGKSGQNVFKTYYNRLVEKEHKPKRNAIGHLTGKLARVIYSCLKNNVEYDPKVHAIRCGIPWDDSLATKGKNVSGSELLQSEAEDLASSDVEIE